MRILNLVAIISFPLAYFVIRLIALNKIKLKQILIMQLGTGMWKHRFINCFHLLYTNLCFDLKSFQSTFFLEFFKNGLCSVSSRQTHGTKMSLLCLFLFIFLAAHQRHAIRRFCVEPIWLEVLDST